MRLSEPIEKSGYFWVPGKLENKLPGTLRISAEAETRLEVIGIFGDSSAAFNTNELGPSRVVGVLENGDLVTLDRCFYEQRNISFGGISKSTIYANFVFSGAQYDEGEEITFSRFGFSVEGLDEWLSMSGITIERNRDTRGTSIHFTPPQELSYQLPDGVGLKFTFSWTTPGGPNLTEAKITQKAYMYLSSDEVRPIQSFLDLVFKINNFMCFATDATVSLDSATGFSPEITRDFGNGNIREIPIQIYYQSIPYSEVTPKIRLHYMLFHYHQVADRFEKILTSWLANYETSQPAFNLYFGSKAGAYKYLDGRFLSLAQGIETLHRRNSQETLMPQSEFNDLVDAILKFCPSDKQEWLAGRLKYANELPLRQRMKQMIEPFGHLYGTPKERKSFVRKVIDTRNYLTHYDSSLLGQTVRGGELWNLCMKLEALFQLHFLKLIGLEDELIEKLVSENYVLSGKLRPN